MLTERKYESTGSIKSPYNVPVSNNTYLPSKLKPKTEYIEVKKPKQEQTYKLENKCLLLKIVLFLLICLFVYKLQ